MSQIPPRRDDDVALSEDEIRAMSASLRKEYSQPESGVVGSVGKVVATNVEGFFRRLLLLFRLPILIITAVAGFFFWNSREGVTFAGALALALLTVIIVAAIHGTIIRVIDARTYRREIGT
jgi:uncharacterized membrane protein